MASLCKNINTSSCSDEDDVVDDLRRGPWTLEEDTLLLNYIAWHGEGRWNLLAKRAGLRRTGKSCRLRWLNYLKPDVKRGNLTPQEQLLILDLHSKWGNRWSKIAQHLPGRTDNEIKNYWRTRVQKQARHLNVDPNSTAFQDIIRCFWIPRLVQKIQNSAPNSSASILLSQNPTNIPHHQPISNILTPPPSPQLPVAQNLEVPRIQILEQNEQNSDSDHCASSCISSNSTDQSMNISDQLSHFSSEVPCYVDNNCYDMEAINLVGLDGGFGNPGPAANCRVAESNCGIYGFGDTEWNTDELWQFRNLHER